MILIIDHDLAAASSLERMLRFTGHDSLSVSDGMEALNLLAARTPQLILLDINLPGPIHGLLLLQSIRNDPNFASIPIWIFSEEFSQPAINRALLAGAQNYIVKGTIGYTSLVQRIDALLRAKP